MLLDTSPVASNSSTRSSSVSHTGLGRSSRQHPTTAGGVAEDVFEEERADALHGRDARATTKPGRDRRDTGNGMLNASLVASRWAIAWRHVIVRLLSKLPGTRFKSKLVHRLLGVKMGTDVGFAYGSMLDPYDPSMISFGNNVIVGYEAKIFVHMFTLNRQRIRPVTVGNDVIIGACAMIAPGVTIGDGASIAPGTIVNRNIPAGAMAVGNPMVIKKRGKAEERGEGIGES